MILKLHGYEHNLLHPRSNILPEFIYFLKIKNKIDKHKISKKKIKEIYY